MSATNSPLRPSRRLRLSELPLFVFLFAILAITLYPFVWTILDSLNSTQGIFKGELIPSALHWSNYQRAWVTGNMRGPGRVTCWKSAHVPAPSTSAAS